MFIYTYMHSTTEKFNYFMNVRKEIDDIIYDAIDLDIDIVVEMIIKHLASYNNKNKMYILNLTPMDSSYYIYEYNMREKVNHTFKKKFKDVINIKSESRSSKINSLFGK